MVRDAVPAGRDRRSQHEIRSLTGLRGLAACWVVFYHLHEDDVATGAFSQALTHGYLAVDIFFILSGFVMAMSYKHLFEDGFSRRAYLIFLGRRLARIWPLYAIATLLFTLIYTVSSAYGIIYNHVTLDSLPFLLPVNLAMMQTWGLGRSLDLPAWSISAEFFAYLLFPVLATLTLFSGRVAAVVVTVLAFLAICALPVLAGKGLSAPRPLDISDFQAGWPLLRCVAEFSIGLAIFGFASDRRVARLIGSPSALLLVPIAMLIVTTLPHTDIAFVGLSAILIMQLSWGHGTAASFLSWSPLHYLGTISYGLYLVHYALLHLRSISHPLSRLTGSAAADPIADLVVLGTAVIAASIAYRVIELPCRRAIKRGLSRLEPETARLTLESERAGVREVTGRLP